MAVQCCLGYDQRSMPALSCGSQCPWQGIVIARLAPHDGTQHVPTEAVRFTHALYQGSSSMPPSDCVVRHFQLQSWLLTLTRPQPRRTHGLIQNFSSGVVEKPKRVLNLAVRNGTYIANPESTRAFLDMVLGYD